MSMLWFPADFTVTFRGHIRAYSQREAEAFLARLRADRIWNDLAWRVDATTREITGPGVSRDARDDEASA